MGIHERIDVAIDNRETEKPRRYIGASSLYECRAAIAFQLRGFPSNPPDAKLQRIFDLGHVLEDVVVAHLKEAGLTVFEVDPKTGKQWRYTEWGGHIKCHLDGFIRGEHGELHVLEIKSMNKSMFNKFVNHGVAKSHPHYLRQVHLCMALSKTPRSILVAYCKDDSRYHSEVIEEDPFVTASIKDTLGKVLNGDHPRIAPAPTNFRCKMCNKSQACWGNQLPEPPAKPIPSIRPVCATCTKSSPTEDGLWHCALHDAVFGPDEGCPAYKTWNPENE